MSAKPPRIPPVPKAEWTDAMRDVFAAFEGPPAREAGSKFKAIMTLAHHPELAKAWLDYNVFLSTSLSLPKPLCEVVILRIAWRCESEYEWTQHVVIGEGVGLTQAHIEGAKKGPGAAVWTECERLCLQVVDELLTTSQVEDEVWTRLEKHLDKKQLLELLFLIGTYGMLAWVFNALRVEPEQMSTEQRREVIFSADNVYGKRGNA